VSDAALPAISAVMAEFAYRLDRSDGARMHELFTPDGRYTIDGATLRGRDAIRRGFRARSARGPRTARHVSTNVRVVDVQPGRITADSVMLLWAADGVPPIDGTTPLSVADVLDVFEQLDDRWLFAERTLTTVFRGAGTAVTPMSAQPAPQEGSAAS
jgi:uncharacterized protein (TIGR02246 family)